MIRALHRDAGDRGAGAGPLPLGRRPHEPRRRRGHDLPLHPRRRRRPGGHRRRARRAQGAHARARARLAAGTSASSPRSSEIESDDQSEIVEEARTVLLDGVRRIGGEVRNSLDFHHAQEGMSLRVQRAVLTGAAATVPGFDDALAAELGLPVESGQVERRARGPRPASAHRRGRPGRRGGPARMRAVNLIPADDRRGAGGAAGRSSGGAYILLGALALIVAMVAAYTLAGKSVSDKKAELARVNAEAARRRRPGRRPGRLHQVRRAAHQARRDRQAAGQQPLRLGARAARGRARHAEQRLADARSTRPPRPASAAPAAAPCAARSPCPAIEVSGCTTSQSSVARVMARLRLIDGVKRVSLQDSTKSSAAGGAARRRDRRLHRRLQPLPEVQHRRLLRAGGPAPPRRPTATTATAASVTSSSTTPRQQHDPGLVHHLRRLGRQHPVTTRDRTVLIVVAALAAGRRLLVPGHQPQAQGGVRRRRADRLGPADAGRPRRPRPSSAQAARDRYDRDYATVARLGKAVPVQDDVPSLVYQLETTAHDSHVDFRRIALTASASAARHGPDRGHADRGRPGGLRLVDHRRRPRRRPAPPPQRAAARRVGRLRRLPDHALLVRLPGLVLRDAEVPRTT